MPRSMSTTRSRCRPIIRCGAAPNVSLTPHIGYVTEENYRSSYPQIVENIVAFLDGNPVRVIQG